MALTRTIIIYNIQHRIFLYDDTNSKLDVKTTELNVERRVSICWRTDWLYSIDEYVSLCDAKSSHTSLFSTVKHNFVSLLWFSQQESNIFHIPIQIVDSLTSTTLPSLIKEKHILSIPCKAYDCALVLVRIVSLSYKVSYRYSCCFIDGNGFKIY